MARFLIIAGIILVILGILLNFFPKIGHLPGDIYIEKPHGRIIIPITSMVIISVVLTVMINLVLWILSKIR